MILVPVNIQRAAAREPRRTRRRPRGVGATQCSPSWPSIPDAGLPNTIVSIPVSGMEGHDGLHCRTNAPGTAPCSAWLTGGCSLNILGTRSSSHSIFRSRSRLSRLEESGHGSSGPKLISRPLSDDQISAMVVQHQRVWFVLYPDELAVPGYETSRHIEAALTRNFNRVSETKQYTADYPAVLER